MRVLFFSVVIGEDGLQSTARGEGFLLRFCFCAGFGVQTGDELSREVEGEDWL